MSEAVDLLRRVSSWQELYPLDSSLWTPEHSTVLWLETAAAEDDEEAVVVGQHCPPFTTPFKLSLFLSWAEMAAPADVSEEDDVSDDVEAGQQDLITRTPPSHELLVDELLASIGSFSFC
jgi:hypothetical protein